MASTSSRSRLARRSSARTTLTSPKGWAVGTTPVEVERGHVLAWLEYLAELLGEEVEFGVAQGEPGEPGDVRHVLAAQR